METLASGWARDPRDLGEKSSVWESQCGFSPPASGLMWTQQLPAHLQRNKQLQDTLLQREEELARLQDENNKLREFLNSSFVRNLEQKAKKLTTDGRRQLKRNLMHNNDGPFQNQLPTSQQVSKRVCRNLTAEFCSDPSETSSSSEPNLDLWVLRTLGLKDRDTIDTSSDSPSSGYSLCSSVYDPAVTSSLSSSFSSSVVTSTPSSVHSCCQTSTPPQAGYGYGAAECRETSCDDPAESPQDCTTSPGLNGQYEAPEAAIRSYNSFQSPDRAEVCSITASTRLQTLEGHPAKHPTFWSPSQDTVQFSPPGQRVPFSPILSSSPIMNQLWTPVHGGSPTSPSAGSQPQTPRSRTDLAFSMSLSPSNSVKTHSFPQGQAFVRKDTEGRWSFTWVPRHGP